MGFNVIDLDNWERKDRFNHFYNNAKCTYSITVNIDITNFYNYIKTNNLTFYPAFTWVVSKVINTYDEFKITFDEKGRLGFFDEISPSYSVLNDKTKIMNDLYTAFSGRFIDFYNNMRNDIDKYKEDNNFKTKFQNNFFIVSCLPWFNYTAFNVNNEGSIPFLFPMVTWGKFFVENNKTIMPLTIQIHHAVADGYHCSLFFNDITKLVNNPYKYLK